MIWVIIYNFHSHTCAHTHTQTHTTRAHVSVSCMCTYIDGRRGEGGYPWVYRWDVYDDFVHTDIMGIYFLKVLLCDLCCMIRILYADSKSTEQLEVWL